MREAITRFFGSNLPEGFYLPEIRFVDIIEIIIIAFLIYQIILWIKNTKAWMLLKGILVLFGFILVAAIFRMYVILWIADTLLPVMATAVVIIFQPELRRALERLGEKQFLASMVPFDKKGRESARFSEQIGRASCRERV